MKGLLGVVVGSGRPFGRVQSGGFCFVAGEPPPHYTRQTPWLLPSFLPAPHHPYPSPLTTMLTSPHPTAAGRQGWYIGWCAGGSRSYAASREGHGALAPLYPPPTLVALPSHSLPDQTHTHVASTSTPPHYTPSHSHHNYSFTTRVERVALSFKLVFVHSIQLELIIITQAVFTSLSFFPSLNVIQSVRQKIAAVLAVVPSTIHSTNLYTYI